MTYYVNQFVPTHAAVETALREGIATISVNALFDVEILAGLGEDFMINTRRGKDPFYRHSIVTGIKAAEDELYNQVVACQ